MGTFRTFWELMKSEPKMTAEEKSVAQWAEAVKNSNWVMLHQLKAQQNLEPEVFFDKVALGYCYCYAAGVEPTRDADWTAFKKTLENLHYPAMAEAIVLRHDGK